MTNEKAIEILTDLRYFDDDCDTDVEAIEIAIEALEKQIPERLKREKILHTHLCPECGLPAVAWLNYCPKCGQKIDWSEEE